MKKTPGWLKRIVWPLLCGVLITLAPTPAWAEPGLDGGADAGFNQPAELFSVHCVGCHPNGGNIIRRGKTLQAKALNRYGYTDLAAVAQIITHGKGVMSAYGDLLSSEEIQALAGYVLEQAENNWQE